MRRLVLIAGLVLAVGVFLPGSALSAAGDKHVPVNGKLSGYCTTDFSTGASQCLTIGQVSHFGLVLMKEDVSAGPPIDPATYPISTDWRWTAPNGDQLFGTATGTVTFDPDGIHATQVVTYTSSGGTGRLADVTVTFVAAAVLTGLTFDPTTLTGTELYKVKIVGTLSH